MAEAACQQGTSAYQARDFLKAQQFFQKAAQLDTRQPKYSSNLSAVLFEQGKYVQCLKAIYCAWKALEDLHSSIVPSDDPLAVKVVTRAAKAQLNGFFDTSPSEDSQYFHQQKPPVDQGWLAALEEFAFLKRSEIDTKAQEIASLWMQWRRVRAEFQVDNPNHSSLFSNLQREARVRMNKMPLFKSATDPTLEYMKLGVDLVRSITMGADGKVDEELYMGEEGSPSGCWSFLFGGSGDGRHALATLIEVGDFVRHWSPERPALKPKAFDAIKTHMTLIDIHPAAIARSVVIFSLLHDIMMAASRATAVEKAEAYATIFYVFTSMVIPIYCQTRFIESVKRALAVLEHGPSYLHVNERSLPAVLNVLRYWSKPLRKSTTIMIQRNVEFHQSSKIVPDLIGVKPPSDAECFSDFHAHRSLKGDIKDRSRPLRQKWYRPFQPEGPPDVYLRPYYDEDAEARIYDRTGALLPPQTLLARHPRLEAIVKTWGLEDISEMMWANALQEVRETWVPNPVLFDETSTENMFASMEGPWTGTTGYPLVPKPFYDSLFSFEQASRHYHISASDRHGMKTAFGIMSRFFEFAANALYTLRRSLVVEFVVGDLLGDFPRLMRGELGMRPPNSPLEYARIWLSDIPDYTNGILSPLSHLGRHMKSNGVITFHCMRNRDSLPSLEIYLYHYTFLSVEEFPRYLGCRLLTMRGNMYIGSSILQGPFKARPLSELATRNELRSWLVRLFLATLCCGKPFVEDGEVIEMNNSLATFFHLLVYLRCDVGFPSHWIGDFVQELLSNTLVTDAPLYSSSLPIIKANFSALEVPRRIHLAAWQAEMQSIVASTRLALPFSLHLGEIYPRPEDIRTYKTYVNSSLQTPDAPFLKAVSLMLYAPTSAFEVDTSPPRIEDILERTGRVKSRDIQFIQGPEYLDLRCGYLTWKMSQKWYQKMKAERWKVVAFRTDLHMIVTASSPADKWKEI